MKPFLKWAGGKRQLLSVLQEYINKTNFGTYFEPFVGGGSLFLSLAKENCVINDFNPEIINTYEIVRDYPHDLIKQLDKHDKANTKEHYYKIRALDRLAEFEKMNPVERAARTIYLNKTCYNGLYRVNSKGYFNVPYGKYVNPLICDKNNILEISEYLNHTGVTIMCADFAKAVESAKDGDYVYFDPPYDYVSNNGFVQYVKEGFSHPDLIRLKETCDELIIRGCQVLISNNDTPFVRELFCGDGYKIVYEARAIDANRNINCNAKARKTGKEILIYGKKKN